MYSLSNWLKNHPGGEHVVLATAGCDATDPFLVFHPRSVITERLHKFQIGTIETWKPTDLQNDFYGMLDKIEEAGMFQRSVWFNVGKWLWHAILFIAAIWCVLGLPSPLESPVHFWGQLVIGATALGFFWQQIAFHGHDYGHNSVHHNRPMDYIGSFSVTALFGVSSQWWKRNHNTHHVVTNSVDYDPDIQHLPFFSVHWELLTGFFSTYYRRWMPASLSKSPVTPGSKSSVHPASQEKLAGWSLEMSRLLLSNQHYLYYPVMALARYNLHLQSLLTVRVLVVFLRFA